MVKFLVGLVFGAAFCAAVLGALAVVDTPDSPASPAEAPARIEDPDASGDSAAPAPEEAAPPDEATAAEPETAPAAEPQQDAAAAPAQPAETQTESEPAAVAEAETEAPAPEAPAAPMVGVLADSAPQPADPSPAPAEGDGTGDAAPLVAMGQAAPGPAMGGAGPEAFTGPAMGEGTALSAPGFGDESATGIPGSADERPIRIAAAPQQVTPGSADTGTRPSVNTESAAMPEIGGSELADDDRPLGPAPELQPGEALAENAAIFAGDTGRPLMSIVLVDTGENPALRAGLTALTAPITFGVEAAIRDARAVAGDYRDAGFEVSAVLSGEGRLGLVEGMAEDQMEDLLARVVERIPVAATVMDPIDGPLPRDRRMANGLLDGLAVTGHGLLTHRGNGLNNLPIVAAEKGVPAALVYRVIDDQPGAVNISQALERAVLDASRSGHVIVVGRVRQETVTTLFSWLLGSGAREVTIAPASAVLRGTES